MVKPNNYEYCSERVRFIELSHQYLHQSRHLRVASGATAPGPALTVVHKQETEFMNEKTILMVMVGPRSHVLLMPPLTYTREHQSPYKHII